VAFITAFLPTLEKCGKSCQLLLGADEVNFIQTPVNSDGACVSARFYKVRWLSTQLRSCFGHPSIPSSHCLWGSHVCYQSNVNRLSKCFSGALHNRIHLTTCTHTHTQDVLFSPATYSICSKHHNLIAFNVELGLLLRVLRAAGANEAELLEVKLTQKPAPGSALGQSTPAESRPYLTFTGRVSAAVCVCVCVCVCLCVCVCVCVCERASLSSLDMKACN